LFKFEYKGSAIESDKTIIANDCTILQKLRSGMRIGSNEANMNL